MKLPDIDRCTEIIRAVGAEEMLPRFGRLGPGDVRQKGPGDPVTVVDEACERRLAAELTATLPGSVVVGEEAAAADPSVLDRIAGDAPVWILDPLDGTANYANSVNRFAIIVALTYQRKTIAGWIHEPVTGRVGVVMAGEGAYIAGRRLRVADTDRLGEMTGLFNLPGRNSPRRAMADRLVDALAARRPIDCAGTAYLDLADGIAHIAVFNVLKPWDHAAGVLLHQEAGGWSALFDERRYSPLVHQGPMLVAPSRSRWNAIAAMFEKEEERAQP